LAVSANFAVNCRGVQRHPGDANASQKSSGGDKEVRGGGKIWSVDSKKNSTSGGNNFKLKLLPPESYFKAKMHQIRFRRGLCPRTRWELTAPPDPLAGFWVSYF